MADETNINGIASDGDDQKAENYYDFDSETTRVSDLVRKMEALEYEKVELVRENEGFRERIKNLTAEIGELRTVEGKMKGKLGEMERVTEQSESDRKAAEVIAARAAELETEVSRLQHDLVSAMSEGDEANAEVRELKRVLEEKGSSIERIEREKQILKEGFEREVEEVKKAKAISENKVCELEKRIQSMEERESEKKREKVGFEDEAKARIDEKEREICGLKTGIEELKEAVAKNLLELEKEKKEKKEFEVLKLGIEEALKVSVEKVKEMEAKMIGLQKDVAKAEKVICGLKERTAGAVNGVANKMGLDGEIKGGLNWQLPAVAAMGTIIAAGVVCYLQYGKRR